MDMENYRKIIKTRQALLMLPVLLAVSQGVYDVFLASEEVKESFIFGFQSGLAIPLGLFSLMLFIRYGKLLKDEKKLILYFNRENDERLKAIRAKAGIPILPITSILIIIVGVFAGYFEPLIFFTLQIVAISQITICGIIKLVYTIKM